jgi:DNA-binding CsgD family transcriptional regulator
MYDCMVMRVFDSPGASGHISLARSARFGTFQPSDMRLLALLLPHLQRAMQTRIQLAASNIGPDAAVETLDRLDQGVLIVDAEARVAHANRAAEAMLAKGDVLSIDLSGGGRHLRTATPGQTRALRRLIGQASDAARPDGPCGGVLRLLSDGGGMLIASVTPLNATVTWNTVQRPAVLVLLTSADQDTVPSPEHLRALFDLTPAEAAVARRIVLGDGIQAAARTLRITPATVHTHLSRIFDKTETSPQAELVRLLQHVARLN